MSADVAPALRRLFVGSYTDGADRGGIRTIAFGEGGGEAHVVRADGCGANPTYLAQRGSLLFAAHELDSCGRMAAYAIEPDGSLTCRGACTAPYDAGTCFVLPDPNGRNLFGANYLSGSVACCALLDDGRLAAGVPSRRHEGRGLRDDRQEGPHVHSLSFVPGTRLLVAVDLGLDALVIYQVDACGMLAPTAAETVRVPAGSGPRMVAYHPRLPMAALVNELACDVLVFRIDEGGLHWRIVEQLSLPQAPSGDALAAHIAFSPVGARKRPVGRLPGGWPRTGCGALRRCVRREGAAALFAVARRALSGRRQPRERRRAPVRTRCRRDAASGRVRGRATTGVRHLERVSRERRPHNGQPKRAKYFALSTHVRLRRQNVAENHGLGTT